MRYQKAEFCWPARDNFQGIQDSGSRILRNQRAYPFHFSDQSSGNGDKSGLSYHFSRFCKIIIFFELCFQSIFADEAYLLFVQIKNVSR